MCYNQMELIAKMHSVVVLVTHHTQTHTHTYSAHRSYSENATRNMI